MATPLETIPEETQTPPTPPNSPTPTRVTVEVPKTKPAKEKNPGRVESGKRLAERNRLAREAKKKAAANTSASATPNATPSATSSASPSDNSNSIFYILGFGGLLVSAVGVYYQREALQKRFGRAQNTPQHTPAPEQNEVQAAPAPQPSRIPVRKGIQHMK